MKRRRLPIHAGAVAMRRPVLPGTVFADDFSLLEGHRPQRVMPQRRELTWTRPEVRH